VTGFGPVLACAVYAGVLWGIALGLDAIGRRSLRPRHGRQEATAIGSDVASFHRAIGGAALGAGAFVSVAHLAARRDGPALLLVPVAALCFTGAVRRFSPLWREPHEARADSDRERERGQRHS
jgi:hypothetical protein